MNKHNIYFLFMILTIGTIFIFAILAFSKTTRAFFNNIDIQSLQTYINTIHPYQYKNKINAERNTIVSKYQFMDLYLASLQTPSTKYNELLNIHKKYAIDIFSQNNLSNLVKYIQDTNIIMSVNNLEGGMPFTIGNTIILSDMFMEKYYNDWVNNNKSIQINFIETLLHEYLHIIQRKKQSLFDSYYKKHYKYLVKQFSITNMERNIQKKHMTNPDSNNTFWTYKKNGNIYIPILYKDNDKYVPYVVKHKQPIKHKHSNSKYVERKPLLDIFNKIHGFVNVSYHPNETFAYRVSKSLISKDKNRFHYDNINNHNNEKNFLMTL